jgi:hypothetical protein
LKPWNYIDLLRLGTLSLLIFVMSGAGAPANADEMKKAAGPSPLCHDHDGCLKSVIKEDQVLEVFKVRGHPIFYIEFQKASVQSQSLDRMGIFVESDEYHGKILAPERMQTLAADALYDGHDYASEDLARFYTYAAKLAIRLNPMEEHLKNLLIRLGVLIEHGGQYFAIQRAALLSAVAGMDERHGAGTRRWVLDHEFRHGYYFVTLKAGVHEIWQEMLSAREREMITAALLLTARYNPNDSSLMEREFHAMIFESRFEDDLRSLSASRLDGPAKATTAEVKALIDKLPEIRGAFLALERRLLPSSS